MDSPPPQKPSLHAQWQTSRLDDGPPNYGRDALDHAHAIYPIADCLSQLGLDAWLPTLIQWLGIYDGLETHLPDDCDPLLCVRQVLLQKVAKPVVTDTTTPSHEQLRGLKKEIVSEILGLEFLRYIMFWGQLLEPRLYWGPLSQRWMNFMECGLPDEHIWPWRPESEKYWLILRPQLEAFLMQDDADTSAPSSDSA